MRLSSARVVDQADVVNHDEAIGIVGGEDAVHRLASHPAADQALELSFPARAVRDSAKAAVPAKPSAAARTTPVSLMPTAIFAVA